jgi:hypothetical protein
MNEYLIFYNKSSLLTLKHYSIIEVANLFKKILPNNKIRFIIKINKNINKF